MVVPAVVVVVACEAVLEEASAVTAVVVEEALAAEEDLVEALVVEVRTDSSFRKFKLELSRLTIWQAAPLAAVDVVVAEVHRAAVEVPVDVEVSASLDRGAARESSLYVEPTDLTTREEPSRG